MKQTFTPFVILLCLLVSSKGFSQIVWTFSDSMATPSFNSYSDITASAMTSNKNTVGSSATNTLTQTSASKGYINSSGTFNLGAAADTGAFSTGSAYFEFTLTPSLTAAESITSIRFGSRSTGTGPQAYAIRTSLDGYVGTIASDTLTNNSTWVAKNITGLVLPVITAIPVTVRIYGYSGTGSRSAGTVNWRIDDVTINNSVLPVSLTAFSSSVINDKVMLAWTAASEVNLKGYSVEKSSDARMFREISYVAASAKGSYGAEDALSSGISYYRLKIMNANGSYSYSKTIAVNTAAISAGRLQLYPNPVSANAVVSHPQAGSSASLKITDLNGRVLQTYPLQANAVQTTINVSRLTAGTYLLVYRDASGKAVSTRLVKQ